MPWLLVVLGAGCDEDGRSAGREPAADAGTPGDVAEDVGADTGRAPDARRDAARDADGGAATDSGRDADAAAPDADAGRHAAADGGGERAVRARACLTTLSYAPDGPVGDVLVAGEWGWDRPEPMERRDGVFTLAKDLGGLPGTGPYCYKLIVDGEWILDPQNPVQAYCDGVLNSGVRVPDCSRPLLTLDGEPRVDRFGLSGRVLYHAGASGAAPATVTATLVHDFEEIPLPAAFEETPATATFDERGGWGGPGWGGGGGGGASTRCA